MRITGTFLAEADHLCDYSFFVPGLSTVSNLVVLFQKCVYKGLPESTQKNRYWTHIHNKDLFRVICLLIFPIIASICVIASDYFDYQKDKEKCARAIQSDQESKRSLAKMTASLAALTSGVEVSGDQMMPAPTEDQQRLWIGCLANDLQSVQEQLDKKISPNFYHAGNTPLVTACQHGSLDIVRLLLEHGAEANTPDRCGNTPFSAACSKGDLSMVELLRPHIQDIDAAGPKGITPLMFASARGHHDVVQFLIKEGADSRKKAADGGDAFTNAMFPNDHADLLPLLFAEQEEIDQRRYAFQIPGLNPFAFFRPTIRNLTPFLYATIVKAEKSALSLVERSNVQHLDSNLNNALFYSLRHMELLRALLKKCSTPEFVNQQNASGLTPLHFALELDQSEVALLLLECGADPFIPDGDRSFLVSKIGNVVNAALPDGYGDIRGMIADYALEEEQNKEGKTPLIRACEQGFDDVVAYIQKHYGNRITPAIQKQMNLATQAFQARLAQPPQPAKKEEDNFFSSSVKLMETGFKMMQTADEHIEKERRELIDRGPVPRTGMELIFGKLNWPD